MSSGHWQNTGLAKWISDNLYQYNTSDEKSMNPMKWHSIQNGGNLNDTRETINGFPCRLILINDGETPLNEGQNEPTPGNVKDMGIFNFNNDKGNTDTFGLDNSIFPRCVSYEVVANSDTSAGAFVPYSGSDSQEELAYLQDSFELRYPDDKEVGADYGMLGMNGEVHYINYDYNYGLPWTHRIKASYFNTRTFTISIVNSTSSTFTFDEYDEGGTKLKSTSMQQGDSITLQENTYSFQLYIMSSTFDYILINGVKYFVEQLNGRDQVREPFIKTEFSSNYGLKRVIDWVGNATDEEFVRDFEQYFNKEYTFRYYLLVIALGMVDNLGGRSCRV